MPTKLKPVVDAIESLPEPMRDMYEQRQDGKYYLALDGTLPGYVEKGKLDEFRNNNIALQKQLGEIQEKMKSFEGVDLDEIKALKEQQLKLKDKELIDAGKIEELVAARTERLRADSEAKYNALLQAHEEAEAILEQLDGRLASVLIESELSKAVSSVGTIRQGAIQDMINRARGTWTVVDGELRAVDQDGETQIYGRDGKTPLTMSEWAAGLAESAPYLFEPSTGGGSSGNNSGKGGGGTHLKTVPKGDNRAFIHNLEGIAKGEVQVGS